VLQNLQEVEKLERKMPQIKESDLLILYSLYLDEEVAAYLRDNKIEVVKDQITA